MRKKIDLTGMRFGRLTVLQEGEKSGSGGQSRWICICDCGRITEPFGHNLRSGGTKSCGCLWFITAKPKVRTCTNWKHGMCGTHIYKTWESAKSRCFNPKTPQYKNYGGRGIVMCDEWKKSFQAFYDHVSLLPHFDEPGYTLDRIDNNKNYQPGNVRWATIKEQQNNKRKRGI